MLFFIQRGEFAIFVISGALLNDNEGPKESFFFDKKAIKIQIRIPGDPQNPREETATSKADLLVCPTFAVLSTTRFPDGWEDTSMALIDKYCYVRRSRGPKCVRKFYRSQKDAPNVQK